MTFDELIRYKALHLKYISSNSDFVDMLIDGDVEHMVPLKNVCAMVSQPLFDELTNVCGLLDISKRAFIEAALVVALGKAAEIIDAEQVVEHLQVA